MRKLQTLLLTLGMLLLAGCAGLSPDERAALMTQEVEEMIQVYGPACEKLGYQADTDPWRECILKLDAAKNMEYYYQTRSMTVDCWGHRGFYRCLPY